MQISKGFSCGGEQFNRDMEGKIQCDEYSWLEIEDVDFTVIKNRLKQDIVNKYMYRMEIYMTHFPVNMWLLKKGMWGYPSVAKLVLKDESICKFYENKYYRIYYGVARIKENEFDKVIDDFFAQPICIEDQLIVTNEKMQLDCLMNGFRIDTNDNMIRYDTSRLISQIYQKTKALVFLQSYSGENIVNYFFNE